MRLSISEVIEDPITGEWGNEGGNVKVLRTTNFTNEGFLNLNDIVLRDIDSKKVELKKLKPGDIIIEKSGGSPNQPVGRVVYFNENDEFLCNNFTSILRPKKELIFPKYLHYILFGNHRNGITNNFQNKTTGIINLKLNRYLKEVKIPLHSLETQKKIAVILDAADEYRQKTKALIEKYDQLAQSLFLEMFGDLKLNNHNYSSTILNSLALQITDGEHLTPIRESNGYKLLSCRNIKNGYIDLSVGVDYVGESEYLRMIKRCKPEKGNILISCSGTIGRVTVIRTDDPFVLVRSAALVKLKENLVNPTYIEFYLRSNYMQSVIFNRAKTSSQSNLFTAPIKQLPILIPPKKTQDNFEKNVSLILNQKQQAQATLQKAEELFNSLLQRAFKGELV